MPRKVKPKGTRGKALKKAAEKQQSDIVSLFSTKKETSPKRAATNPKRAATTAPKKAGNRHPSKKTVSRLKKRTGTKIYKAPSKPADTSNPYATPTKGLSSGKSHMSASNNLASKKFKASDESKKTATNTIKSDNKNYNKVTATLKVKVPKKANPKSMKKRRLR